MTVKNGVFLKPTIVLQIYLINEFGNICKITNTNASPKDVYATCNAQKARNANKI